MLLERYGVEAAKPWSTRALGACLRQLVTSPGGSDVAVRDAWIDGPRAFCVVYESPSYEGVLGLRRSDQAIADGVLYDSHGAGADAPEPVAFGYDVADNDLGEPLGGAAETLRTDADGVRWWGCLLSELPAAPARSGRRSRR
jgi:hypothetical protein